jgi:predicted nucleotidyltransferase component of viral defense system
VVEELQLFGITAQVRNAWQSVVGYSFDVSYQGPLYDGRDRTKGKVRVDCSLRQEAVESRRELVSSPYDDLRPFVINVITPEYLLAEKVRALVMREAPRDAYDLWLLDQQGIALLPELVNQKLAIVDVALSQNALTQALDKAGKDWQRDLQPLLPQLISWDDVAPILKRKLAIIIL